VRAKGFSGGPGDHQGFYGHAEIHGQPGHHRPSLWPQRQPGEHAHSQDCQADGRRYGNDGGLAGADQHALVGAPPGDGKGPEGQDRQGGARFGGDIGRDVHPVDDDQGVKRRHRSQQADDGDYQAQAHGKAPQEAENPPVGGPGYRDVQQHQDGSFDQ